MNNIQRTALLIASLVLLIGCAPEVTRDSADSVIIKTYNKNDVEDVMELAEAACAKHGKVAKIMGNQGQKWVFNCE